MYRSGIILLCFLCSVIPGFLCIVKDEEIIRQETSTFTIDCDVLSTGDTNEWFKGFCNDGSSPCANAIFRKYKDDAPKKDSGKVRKGIDVYHNFTLVFHDALLADEDTYTCKATGRENSFHSTKLLMYIQPEVTLEVEPEKDSYNATDNVTVTCHVSRVYPQLTDETCYMEWNDGNEKIPLDETADGNRSYTYSLTKPHGLKPGDTHVICAVTDFERGEDRHERLNFTVLSDPQTYNGGLSPGEIAGIVVGVLAGVAIVIVAIVIVSVKNCGKGVIS